MFNHQRLKCYQMTIEVLKRIPTLTKTWPRGHSYLVDQLKRAMSSVALNLGEGNGRRSAKERRHFFEIALGSINEVSAIMDVARAIGILKHEAYESIQDMLKQIAMMIYKLP